MKSPKISVIIPVYGVEKYIERCAVSLFEQSLDYIEYIFVDDCTLDSSISVLNKVIERYPNRKNQIHILHHNTNKGLPQARKTGVQVATGKYIIHCDSDDDVDIYMYEKMYNVAEETQSDIVLCEMNFSTGFRMPVIACADKYELLSNIIRGRIIESLCNKLVKRSIYANDIFYPINSANEDFVLSLQLISYSNSFVQLDTPLYNYHIHGDSLSNRIDKDVCIRRCLQYAENVEHSVNFLKKLQMYDCFRKDFDVKKVKTILLLKPFLQNHDVAVIFKDVFKEVNISVYFNRHIPFRQKLILLIANIGMYNLVYKIIAMLRN